MRISEGLTGVVILPLVLGSRWDRRGINHVYAGAPVSNITISADGLVQCSEATISWTNTKPPVNVRVGTGGYYVGVDWLTTLHSDDTSTTWTVDQPSGTSLIFEVMDDDGELAYVQNQKVQGSGDDSCLSVETDAETSAAPDSEAVGGAVAPETSGGTATQAGGVSVSASATAGTDSDSELSTSLSRSKSKKNKSSSVDSGSTTSTPSSTTTTSSNSRSNFTPAVAGNAASSNPTSAASTPTVSAQAATKSGASSLSIELPFEAVNGAVALLLVGVSVMIWL